MLVRDCAITNFIKIVTSTLASLAHIDSDGKSIHPSQFLYIVQKSYQLERHNFPYCDTNMNIIKPEFTHGGVGSSFDSCVEQNIDIGSNNSTLKVLKRVRADHLIAF